MDHVVYLDAKAKELDIILEGKKTMIIRGAAGRKMPYGRVNKGDTLYFMENNSEGKIKAKANVVNVLNSDKMDAETSISLVTENQDKLCLTRGQMKKWAGKRYLVLVSINNAQKIEPKKIDKSGYSNMDDWLPVEDINSVIV